MVWCISQIKCNYLIILFVRRPYIQVAPAGDRIHANVVIVPASLNFLQTLYVPHPCSTSTMYMFLHFLITY